MAGAGAASGAGEAGLITKRTLEREGSARYSVEAFVDDDHNLAGKRLEGVRVHHTHELPKLLAEGRVDQVIIKCVVETSGAEHSDALFKHLESKGYPVVRGS